MISYGLERAGSDYPDYLCIQGCWGYADWHNDLTALG